MSEGYRDSTLQVVVNARELQAVDILRRLEPDLPTRPEMVRRLIWRAVQEEEGTHGQETPKARSAAVGRARSRA